MIRLDTSEQADQEEHEVCTAYSQSTQHLEMSLVSTVNSHLADTPIIRTAAKSLAKTKYRRTFDGNKLLLIWTLTRGPHSVRY